MLRGNWGGGFAVVAALASVSGALFYSYIIGNISGRLDTETSRHAARYEEATSKDINECHAKADRAQVRECVNNAIKSSHENQRDEYDLQAQREMSNWAFWLLIVTILHIPLTIGGLIALIKTIEQGRDANKISQHGLNAIQKLEEGKLLLIYSNARIENHVWRCTLQAANLGRSPILIQDCNSSISSKETTEDAKPIWFELIADKKPIIITGTDVVELMELQWTIEDISACPFLDVRIAYSTSLRNMVVRYQVIRPIIDGEYGGMCNYIFVREWEKNEN
jgi:hypothetical protein